MVEHSRPDTSRPRRLGFGPFVFDMRTYELFQDSRVVHLAPKPTAILAMLLEHPGRLITREEFYSLGWGHTVVTFDIALNTVIRQIRRTLNDQARNPRYVETVPRRGYRFVAQVVEVGAPRSTRGPRSGRRSATRCGAVAVLLGIIGLALFARRSDPPSVEVLPVAVSEEVALGNTGAVLEARIRGTLARRGKARVAVWGSEPEDRAGDQADFSIRGKLHRTDREDPWFTVEVVRTADETVVWGGAFNPMCDRLDDPTGAIAHYLALVLLPRIS